VTNKQPLWKNPIIVAALIAAIATIVVALIQILSEQTDRPQTKTEVNIPNRPNISGIWISGTGRYTVTQEGNKIVWDGIGRYGNKVWHHKGKGIIEGDTITARFYEQPDSNFPGIEGGARTEGSIAADVQTISWTGQNPQERIWRRIQ
jgi:hypothetical protein